MWLSGMNLGSEERGLINVVHGSLKRGSVDAGPEAIR